MIPVIAGIIQGISLVSDLFTEGKKVYEVVTGVPSAAATPDALEAELATLPVEQQQKWADQMQLKIEEYKAETDRLEVQGGRVDAETLSVIPEKERAKIAVIRMTTRPWTVRWCVRGLVFPPLTIITLDGLLVLLNIFSKAFGWTVTHKVLADGKQVGETILPLEFDQLAPALLQADAGFTTLYSWFAGTATSIIITYMTLRQVGKHFGQSDGPSVSDLVGKAMNVVKAIRR